MRAVLPVLFLVGCANQFEATYEPTGTWSHAEFKGTPEGCAEGFITELEGTVALTGSFPEFESSDLTEGTIEILGQTIELEIDAATKQNTSKGYPVDDTASYDFEGTTWNLEFVDYETKHSCGDCKDEIVVRLMSSVDCYPWPVYRPE